MCRASLVEFSQYLASMWIRTPFLMFCRTFKDDLNVYLVMELAPKGELWDLLQKAPDKKLPLELARHYAAEMVFVPPLAGSQAALLDCLG